MLVSRYLAPSTTTKSTFRGGQFPLLKAKLEAVLGLGGGSRKMPPKEPYLMLNPF